MTTVGSLAYSIVANTQNFTAGIAASKSELKTLREAFLASQTPVERFSQAISYLETLATKFPEKANAINRTIMQMRAEMDGTATGAVEAAHGTNEFSSALEKVDRRLGRMALAEVWGTLKEIPGATIAVDLAFGNWLGAAVGALSMAIKLIEEQNEALNMTADAYESATEKLLAFYEAQDKAREKGRARDRLTDSGLSGDAEKAAVELGMGRLGYSASGTSAGRLERSINWLREHNFSGIGFPISPAMSLASSTPGETREKAIELGKQQIEQERESRRLAEKFTESREKWFEDFNRDWEKAGDETEKWFEDFNRAWEDAGRNINDRWLSDFWKGFEEAGERAEKARLDAVNRSVDYAGKKYDANEKKAEEVARGQMSGAEKLREEFQKIEELEAGGFFDLHPGTYDRALSDLRDRAGAMAQGDTFKGITPAVMSASAEGIAARFGSQGTTEKQLREQQKTALNTAQANILLGEIKTAIANTPALGVVP